MVSREIDNDLGEIIRHHLPPMKPHIGRPRRDPRGLINGILYVLTTGCTWADVPAKYGTKSTVHRYHLELCEKGVYQAFFLELLRPGYENRKTRKIRDFPDRKLRCSFRVDLSHCATDTRDIPAKKGNRPVMMAIKR
jgi:transposase